MKIFAEDLFKIQLAVILIIFSFNTTLAQVRNFEKVGQEWKTNLNKHSVKLNEFNALIKRDGIPPIDEPNYLTTEKAKTVYFEHEPLIVIENNGAAKAFPLNILTYHEIVNDKIGDLFFTATYCPLCNAAIVFNRNLSFKGENYLLDFGVSGMLRSSDLVMWDRQTESWWQQFMGEGLVGELTGATLEMLPAQIISLAEFIDAYPDGKILSRETGFEKQQENYGTNVYEGYDSRDIPYERHFTKEVDNRLPAMERIIDIEWMGEYKIYPHTIVTEKQVINDSFKGLKLALFYQSGTKSVMDTKDIKQAKDVGSITVFERVLNQQELTFKKVGNQFIDDQTSSVWTITGRCTEGEFKGETLKPIRYGNHFAFSWFAFHPESVIYE